MVVVVDRGTVRLDQPEDCARFHVLVVGDADLVAVADALTDAGAGRIADDAALVSIDAVRRMAAGRVGPAWDDDFAAMVRFAETKGWLADDGASIQAHIERA